MTVVPNVFTDILRTAGMVLQNDIPMLQSAGSPLRVR